MDIISISWGFHDDSKKIKDALDNAHRANIIIVAAAGNYRRSDSIAFPARLNCVICIGASDGKGDPAYFNTDEPNRQHYATLGIAVRGASIANCNVSTNLFVNLVRYLLRSKNDTECKSGTSAATPIAAGIAALLLDYTRASRDVVKTIKNNGDMRKLFYGMSSDYGGTYRTLEPWRLLDQNIEASRRKIADALANGNVKLLIPADNVYSDSAEIAAPKTALKRNKGTSVRTLSTNN